MTKRILSVAITAVSLMVLSAGAAKGDDGGRSTLAVSLAPDFALPVSCPEPQFGFGLAVDSLAGRPLGTGSTCISSIDGCDPFVAFCRQTVHSTLTLDLARGSLTAALYLLEIRPTESSFIQFGRGEVSAGTGIYGSARGHVTGGGTGSFDEQGNFSGRLVYVAKLRDVAR